MAVLFGAAGLYGLEILFLAQTSEAKKAGPRNKKKKKNLKHNMEEEQEVGEILELEAFAKRLTHTPML